MKDKDRINRMMDKTVNDWWKGLHINHKIEIWRSFIENRTSVKGDD